MVISFLSTHVWHHFWPISSQYFRMLPSTCIVVCHHFVFLKFLCWCFRELKLRFLLNFIIKWRQAGLSRYFSTLKEKFCISAQPWNILYKSDSQIKAMVISILGERCCHLFFLFLLFFLLLSYYTQRPEAKILAFCREHPKKYQSPGGEGGNVLWISSDGDDLIGPKLKTQNNS